MKGKKPVPNLSRCVAILIFCLPNFALADLIPPQVQAARERLQANPDAFDRFDTFCAGKRRGNACEIPGSTFAGGGKGVCTNAINGERSSIDLSCVRSGAVEIDRKLPKGGFVHDEALCRRQATAVTEADRQDSRQWNCTPLQPTPADRFCEGKTINGACTVELVYQGKVERHDGVCKTVTETESFYFQGRRTARRDVIQCEPDKTVRHEYAPAAWWKKLAP
jgi:hypothetical protein